MAQAGVNRVSLGVQALNATDLRFLGREHSAEEALDAIGTARRHFGRYSFDLIYARPGQTLADWRAEPYTSPPGVDALGAYGAYGHPLFRQPALGGRLHWASTETATDAPGQEVASASAVAPRRSGGDLRRRRGEKGTR